jgi:hypothetical protein
MSLALGYIYAKPMQLIWLTLHQDVNQTLATSKFASVSKALTMAEWSQP